MHCLKPSANGNDIVGCYILCPFAHPVACCCAKFETGQTFSYVQMDTTTPNIVGQKCWELLHPFAPSLSVSRLICCRCCYFFLHQIHQGSYFKFLSCHSAHSKLKVVNINMQQFFYHILLKSSLNTDGKYIFFVNKLRTSPRMNRTHHSRCR